MEKPSILLVEDDLELSSLLSRLLETDGFQVETAVDGETGLEKALTGRWDIIVLDIMLPGIDGLEILRRLRPQCKTPVMMLTARGEELDRIVGFELGADDYLPKPFNPRELNARLKAMLRRVQFDTQSEPITKNIEIGSLTISLAAREASVENHALSLTQAEFDLLATLAKHPGETQSKEFLYESVLDRKITLYDRALDVHISNLRRKLSAAGLKGDPIKTIRGIGYLYLNS